MGRLHQRPLSMHSCIVWLMAATHRLLGACQFVVRGSSHPQCSMDMLRVSSKLQVKSW